jgi:hypothetical protein
MGWLTLAERYSSLLQTGVAQGSSDVLFVICQSAATP